MSPRSLPHLTLSLIREFEKVDALTTADRLAGIQAQAGNPWGVETKRFGRAHAFVARNLPVPSFNRIVGLGVEELPLLEDVATFLRQYPVKVHVEVLPGDLSEALSARLTSLGFRHTRFHAGFYGEAEAPGPSSSSVRVRPVCSTDEFDAFLEAHFEGYEMPASLKANVLANMRHWQTLKDWHLYVAEIDEIPAAAAILRIHETLGYLASASTIPRFRRRGCQSALLVRRLRDAGELGCELVCSQAEFGSASHRNLERAGLRLAYTKAIWTQP